MVYFFRQLDDLGAQALIVLIWWLPGVVASIGYALFNRYKRDITISDAVWLTIISIGGWVWAFMMLVAGLAELSLAFNRRPAVKRFWKRPILRSTKIDRRQS